MEAVCENLPRIKTFERVR